MGRLEYKIRIGDSAEKKFYKFWDIIHYSEDYLEKLNLDLDYEIKIVYSVGKYKENICNNWYEFLDSISDYMVKNQKNVTINEFIDFRMKYPFIDGVCCHYITSDENGNSFGWGWDNISENIILNELKLKKNGNATK